jgi:hypothetical protein
MVLQQASAGGNVEVVGTGLLTLREQQVLQLRREMLHPGGVRLQLRRKDCTGSIALVDAFGAVWYVETCAILYLYFQCEGVDWYCGCGATTPRAPRS